MKIVVIGCAPTALGFAHRLHELQTFNDLAKDIELLVLEKVFLMKSKNYH